LLLAIIALSGCADKSKPWVALPSSYDKYGNAVGIEENYFVVSIENCQYILIGSNDNRTLTHKGDCNNPIHYYNVEKQEQMAKETSR
jgi:hypothetical protein